ncbi:carrier superfamily protein [Besnoitia besnoiti]|uniref:Carrier superfamily protein n=1 Tax=Besnoitia besnoiti TaxID=94643 RepID=A0A2A9MNF9_BESBE|nr:carrier superfamily protein [Besnoitia besnoiti]PFH37397.1 carrier superfamily protein [Besnoitia besnoiti]
MSASSVSPFFSFLSAAVSPSASEAPGAPASGDLLARLFTALSLVSPAYPRPLSAESPSAPQASAGCAGRASLRAEDDAGWAPRVHAMEAARLEGGGSGGAEQRGTRGARRALELLRASDAEATVLVKQENVDWIVPLCATCHVVRGALAGSTAKTVVYPLDRLKLHLQATASGQTFRLAGAFEVLKQMAAPSSGGFKALWKGNGCAFVRAFPYSGVSFYAFDRYKRILKSEFPAWPVLCHLGAGSAAGMTATLVTYPLDVLNTRMALTQHRLSYSQVSLLRVEGYRSLFRGLAPTALGIMPYAGISFCTFETLREKFMSEGVTMTPLVHALCGGTAGVVGQTATYPLDTVRKFMQSSTFLYQFQETGHSGSASSPSIVEAIKFLYRQSGWRGFYNGVSLNWCKGFVAAGLAFSLNEAGKTYFTPAICLELEKLGRA